MIPPKKSEIINQASQVVGFPNNEEKQQVFDEVLKTRAGSPRSAFKLNLSGLEVIAQYIQTLRIEIT